MRRAGGSRAAFGCGVAILVLVSAAPLLHLPGSIWAGALWRKDAVVGLLAAAGVLYAAAVRLVLRGRMPALGLPGILAVALLMRACLLAAPPFMSTDVYRYVWDGRVQAAGISPYRYVPADPALARLRDAAIYPNINRLDYARTIYPPVAQAIFAAVGRLSQTVLATKAALVLLELAGMAAMIGVLGVAGLPPERLLIYAWNPLAAWSIAAEGHIDGAAIGLLGLALLARCRGRPALTGVLLAGAALTKFLPLVAAPALWRRGDWRMPLACVLAVGAAYACYAGVGWRVLGFLPSYASEEGMAQGHGFWLLQLLGSVVAVPPLAGPAYLLAGAAILGALALRVVTRPQAADPRGEAVRVCGDVALLASVTVVVLDPHYPWYYAWLALPSVVAPSRAALWLSVAPVLLYCDPFHDVVAVPTLVFVPAAALAVADRLTPLEGAPS